MKRFAFVVIAAAVASLILGNGPARSGNRTLTPQQISIRVTSNTPGEQITFEGSYIFEQNGPEYKTITHTTPFEIGMTTSLVSGIFHKVSGKGDLKVEVLKQAGTQKNAVVSGWGDAVVVGTSNDPKHNFFVQTY